MNALTFTIEGRPRSKARTRVVQTAQGPRFFKGNETRAWERLVATTAMVSARHQRWPLTKDGRLSIEIGLFYDDDRIRDIDRAVNAIFDGITQSCAVWADDSQVDSLNVYRHFRCPNPRTIVRVEVLGE